MNRSKDTYTPAPWRVATKSEFKLTADYYHKIVALEDHHPKNPGFSITGCVDIHDALLIAAAPDLLESLKAVVQELKRPDYEIWCDHAVGICACGVIRILEAADKAIAKAQLIQEQAN